MVISFQSLAQQASVSSADSSSALKPWMQRYLYPNQNLTANLPLRKSAVVSPKFSYKRIENRNQFDQEKLSPYLNKVYLQKMHNRSENDLLNIANQTNFYDPANNLINKAWGYLLSQRWKKGGK